MMISDQNKRMHSMDYAELARRQNRSSTQILEESLSSDDCIVALTSNYRIVADIALCVSVIEDRREKILLEHATKEYQFALFALHQGFYRHAFSALRLSFELLLSSIEFSANELALRQWESGALDINWSRLLSLDSGVFSKNFIRAFSLGLEDRGMHFRSISEKAYRECSEYVHGNAATHAQLPPDLTFSRSSILAWSDKSQSVHIVFLFLFFARYVADMSESRRKIIEESFLESLGYIKEVRFAFGATV